MPSTRAILIEDQVLVRDMLGERLGDLFTVDAACATVADGIAACLRHKPDVVLFAWSLPDGNSLDIVRTVAPKLPSTRWIAICSHEFEHIVRESITAGVHGFVMKRSSETILRDAITAVTAGGTYYCKRSSDLLINALHNETTMARKSLTSREEEILRAMACGHNAKVIAQRLRITTKTVNNHMASVREKLKINEPAGLVHYAIKRGLIDISRA